MNLENNTLYSFKMANGEEIVGKVVEVEGNEFKLERAFAVAMGQNGPQLVPALFTAAPQDAVWMNYNNVAITGNAAEDMTDVYREITTGIKTPEKQIITG